MILDLEQFVQSERPYWDELTAILSRQDADPDWRMSLTEVRRFNYLYQRASSDLVKMKTFAGEVEAVDYLENLVARSYSCLHQKQGTTIPFKPRLWLSRTFPSTFRRHWLAFLLSLAILLVGGSFGAGVMVVAPEMKTSLLGSFWHLSGSPSERVAKEEQKSFDAFGRRHSFAAQLMQNNIRVSIIAMVLGFFYGVPTVMILFHNGVILGVVIFDYIIDGQGVFLTGWLLPHGSVEIPAIVLGGQAGLVVAHAMFGWGTNLRLAERFRRIRSDLLTLVGGAAILLVWAGIVESFLSQYHGPKVYGPKIAFGLIQLLALFGYLIFSGKKTKNRASIN